MKRKIRNSGASAYDFATRKSFHPMIILPGLISFLLMMGNIAIFDDINMVVGFLFFVSFFGGVALAVVNGITGVLNIPVKGEIKALSVTITVRGKAQTYNFDDIAQVSLNVVPRGGGFIGVIVLEEKGWFFRKRITLWEPSGLRKERLRQRETFKKFFEHLKRAARR